MPHEGAVLGLLTLPQTEAKSGQHARVGLGICMVIMDMQVYQLGQLYESFVDLSPASAETLTWPPGWLAQI